MAFAAFVEAAILAALVGDTEDGNFLNHFTEAPPTTSPYHYNPADLEVQLGFQDTSVAAYSLGAPGSFCFTRIATAVFLHASHIGGSFAGSTWTQVGGANQQNVNTCTVTAAVGTATDVSLDAVTGTSTGTQKAPFHSYADSVGFRPQLIGCPVIQYNRNRQLSFARITAITADQITTDTPPASLARFQRNIVTGDSSSPLFLWDGQDFVLLGVASSVAGSITHYANVNRPDAEYAAAFLAIGKTDTRQFIPPPVAFYP